MIGCVIACDGEAEILLSQTEIEGLKSMYGKPVYTGKAFGKDVVIVVCGVGKVNAAAGACAALSKGADVILNFGVAGGLHQNTEVSEIYLIEKAVQYDFDCTQLGAPKIGTLDGETENFLPLSVPEQLGFPRRALGCDVREMEAAAIAQVCKYASVPCVCVKAISDVYGLGSTTDQYRKNRDFALLNLKARLPEIFAALED